MSTTKFAQMGKEELRAACRAAGISYGKLAGNDGMRSALAAAEPVVEVVAMELVAETETTTAPVNNPFAMMCNPQEFAAKAIPTAAATRKIVDGKEVTTKVAPAPVKGDPRAVVEKTQAPVLARVDRKGYLIQKERESRNGVKRPSEGTVCWAIWAKFDAMPAICAAELPMLADANLWDRTTISCQFYTWRKFMGIKGRSSK